MRSDAVWRQRRALGTRSEALLQFIEQAEVLGILVMVSGIVGSNSYEAYASDPEEFGGDRRVGPSSSIWEFA